MANEIVGLVSEHINSGAEFQWQRLAAHKVPMTHNNPIADKMIGDSYTKVRDVFSQTLDVQSQFNNKGK
jgi:hypothetical protein